MLEKVSKQRRLRQPTLTAEGAIALDESAWDESERPCCENFLQRFLLDGNQCHIRVHEQEVFATSRCNPSIACPPETGIVGEFHHMRT
jgi:hypothetical protein